MVMVVLNRAQSHQDCHLHCCHLFLSPVQVTQFQDHLGHKYRSEMQQPNAGSTRARSALRWCPCAFGCCILLLYTCAQDGLDIVQFVLVHVVFSFHQLAKILHFHSWWSSPAATCTAGVFLWSSSTLLMCTQTNNRHILQLALCSGGGLQLI